MQNCVASVTNKQTNTNETSNLSLQVTLSHICLGDAMGLQEILKDFFYYIKIQVCLL